MTELTPAQNAKAYIANNFLRKEARQVFEIKDTDNGAIEVSIAKGFESEDNYWWLAGTKNKLAGQGFKIA